MSHGRTLTLEDFEDPIGWASYHCTIANNRYGSLHQFGMSEKHGDDFIFAGVPVIIETEFGKVTVVSDHVRYWMCQFGDDASECRFIEGLLQVLNDSEIDITFFKEGDRPASVASTRVEVQGQVIVGHVCKLDPEYPGCWGPGDWFLFVWRNRRTLARPSFMADTSHPQWGLVPATFARLFRLDASTVRRGSWPIALGAYYRYLMPNLAHPDYIDEFGFVGPLPASDGQRQTRPADGPTGPEIGTRLPDFALPSASGRTVSFHQDRGSSKAAVVFYRSAVW